MLSGVEIKVWVYIEVEVCKNWFVGFVPIDLCVDYLKAECVLFFDHTGHDRAIAFLQNSSQLRVGPWLCNGKRLTKSDKKQ